MSETTYLITGANRGIGKGLLTTLVSRPNTTVVAAVRTLSSSLSIFSSIPLGQNSKIIPITIDSTSETDPFTAVSELKSTHGISKLDFLISNAGLMESDAITPVLESSPESIRRHIDVNTIAPMLLFQAFHPLLLASANPRFFTISSLLGSIAECQKIRVPFASYGISKAAVNYMVRKLSFEVPEVTSVVFNPGWVQTDMGNEAARGVGLGEAPTGFEDCIEQLVRLFDGVKKEQSGSFLDAATGEACDW
ncbi:similar to aflatoxin biosynthesis ketoreductase nor-1 [Botrytis cinerea T4]|uniref:Similar to aflatoxin biosynthesis ketoreductase nor-1 n=1 Tax=Botryotinia fuckeliana (strain T4) TaxID=999810 RepID=G2YSL6_BOTF4|nr:similar to aflatoxin biosynthesis ketoreductase nor-1 [Botrytis cinerea T4]